MSIFDLPNQAQSPSMGGAGGIDALGGNSVYPLSRMDKTQYAAPSQLPTSADVIRSDYDPETDAFTGMPNQRFAQGGIASIPRFEDGGPTGGHYVDNGDSRTFVEDAPAYSNDNNGNLVDTSGKIVATKEARDDPYISPIASDPTEIQSLYDLKTKDPKQFYSTVADKLGSAMTAKYQTNDNYDNEYNQLQKIKEIDPASYYKNELGFKAHQMGWQVGQNRGERNTANQEAIKSMLPAAQAAGLDPKELGSILDKNFSDARNLNVQRIATNLENGGSGFSFQKDVQPMWPVLAAALTAGAAGAYAGGAGAAEAGTAGVGAADAAAYPGISSADLGLTLTNVPSSTVPYANLGLSSADLGTTATNALNATPSGPLTSADLAKIAQVGDAGGFPASKVAADTAGMNMYQKLALTGLTAKALTSTGGGGATSGSTSTTANNQTPAAQPVQTQPNITSNQYNPLFNMPNMFASNSSQPGTYYSPYIYRYAEGGVADLGGYAAGGKLLKGPGDGMSDDIIANIAGKQPARLADGEFVVPADVVSHLGNGSTDAGAKHLYKMMDRIRQARTGNSKQGKRINPDKFLPKG